MTINTLDLEIMFGDIFEECKTEKDMEWAKYQIDGVLECAYEDRLSDLGLQD